MSGCCCGQAGSMFCDSCHNYECSSNPKNKYNNIDRIKKIEKKRREEEKKEKEDWDNYYKECEKEKKMKF